MDKLSGWFGIILISIILTYPLIKVMSLDCVQRVQFTSWLSACSEFKERPYLQ